MGGGVPLLNEYKQEFLWKRLPQTIFGGAKLRIGYEAPAYVYLTQVLLWAVPALLGGVFTLVLELAYSAAQIHDYLLLYCCLYGACITIFVVVVQTISTVVHMKEKESAVRAAIMTKKKNFLAEEDEVDFHSCCGAETIEFVVPPKSIKLNILFHGLVSGAMCGLTLWYLLPWTLNSLYGNSTGATAALFIFGWFTLSIAQYSLTATAPPEPAIFRTMDHYELSPLNRPFYVLLCLTFHILNSNIAGFEGTNQALHIVFACLPVLWVLGVLPPLEALLLWGLEQVHIFMFGGSPMASNLRLVVFVLVSLCVFLGAYYIPVCLGTVLLSVACGYLLSIDLPSLGCQTLQACRSHNKVSTSLILKDSKQFRPNAGFGWRWGASTWLYHSTMVVVVTGLAAAVHINHSKLKGDVAGWVVVGLCVAEKCSRDLQGVYLFLGLFRNYFFPHSCHHKTAAYVEAKRRLSLLGMLRRVILNWAAPLTMVVYLSINIAEKDVMQDSATLDMNTTLAVWYILGIVRAYRWAWQSTAHALFEVSVVHIILMTAPSNSTMTITLPVSLLVASLVRDRAYQLANKLYFFFALLLSSWTDRKQRRGSTLPTFLLSFILFPLILVILAVAAALSAPLLPLFTLPVFFVAFPRPQRFWPEPVGSSASVCPDTVYYQQLAPMLALSLRKGFATGSLGEPHPGNHYLVRFQDRMVWVMVLERGHAFCTLSIKGLELQETSCHTAEAARLDDIFQASLQKENGVSFCELNEYPLHCLTPVDVCEVQAYSDARNVLTGVIDSHAAVTTTLKFFVRALVWLLLHHVNKLKVHEESQKALKSKKLEAEEKRHGKQRPVSGKAVVARASSGDMKGRTKLDVKLEINHNQQWTDNPANAGFNNNKAAALPPHNLPQLKGLSSNASSLPPLAMDGNHHKSKNTFAFPSLEDGRPASARSIEKSRKSSWSSSINSFSDSLWSDDDLERPKQGKKKPLKLAKVGHSAVHQHASTAVVKPHQQQDKSDVDDLLDELDFGMPVVDISRPKPPVGENWFGGLGGVPATQHRPNNGNHIYKPVTNLAGSPDFKCQYSSHMSLPSKWRELPIENSQLVGHMGLFPVNWYRHVLSTLDWSATGIPAEKVAVDVGADDALTNCYCQLIMACYSAFDTHDKMSGPSYLYKSYMGDVPWNAMIDWLSEDRELFSIVLKSFRLGFKLMLDSMLLGEIEDGEELENSLREFDTQWYVGIDGDPEWKAAVLNNTTNLFSLGHNNIQGTYTSRSLTLQKELLVNVGRLNTEVVRGQWANLSLELMYMTNDDEERYSIQAHPTVLRNLTVQAADPPLGYPIYSSAPISVPTL